MVPESIVLSSDGSSNGGDALTEAAVGFYSGLGTFELGVIAFVATTLAATLVLGLFPGYGSRAVRKGTRSPIVSAVIGLPLATVLGGLVYTGHLIAGSNAGTFFAVPLVALGVILLPCWTGTGFVVIGRAVARRFGSETLSTQVVVGGLASGLAAATLPYGAVVFAIAAAIGSGSGARAAIGKGLGREDERIVPPANRV